MARIIRISFIALVGVLVAGGGYYVVGYLTEETKTETPVLHLGGTSNVYIIMENRWRKAYGSAKGVELKFMSTGSTQGIREMSEGKFAVAFTHTPLSDEEKQKAKAKGGEVVQIPVLMCAVVPVYNVKELNDKPPLNFSGEVLAGIFLGNITRWNDPALAKLNEGVKLPETKIVPVRRLDSSGTTYIFTDYLFNTSKAWQDKIGKPTSDVSWPEGSVGKKRSEGVYYHVEATEGAIGYVDLLHVINGKMPFGAVENKDKTAFVLAKADYMTAAAESALADNPDDPSFSLTNKPGKNAYPICGAIWAICYQKQPAKQEKMVTDFLQWAAHDGQQFAEPISFAPLPEELVKRADERIKSIRAAP